MGDFVHESINAEPVMFFNIAWRPQIDITVWELARALPIMFVMSSAYAEVGEMDFEKLPAEVRRHFEVGE